MKFHIVLHEFSLSGCTATTKPEVVITMRRYEIEMRFRRLDIGFRGRQSQWNIDRHEVPYSSAWILPIWMHGDHETGSSYNYASARDRNAISVSRYRFSRTPESMKHRPTWNSAQLCKISQYLHARHTTKPEVIITMCRYKIEMQFRRLDIGFCGCQSQWNIDRDEVPYSSAWILPCWMYGDLEIGVQVDR